MFAHILCLPCHHALGLFDYFFHVILKYKVGFLYFASSLGLGAHLYFLSSSFLSLLQKSFSFLVY